MEYLPLFTNLKGKDCLVVGGGLVAHRKASLLARAGARVHVVAPELLPEIVALARESGGEALQRAYDEHCLDSKFIVIAATDDEALNRCVSEQAHARHIPINVVDNPQLSSFILPAVIDRSPVVIAVSSGGRSPVLARMLKSQLDSTIPAAFGRLATLVGRFRDKVKQRFADIDDRRHFWEEVLQGPIAEMVFAGRDEVAGEMLERELEQGEPAPRGEVYLVGAGPGDPDLLTFKALRLMQKADVVLYDRLVAKEILDMTRKDAEHIYVGKARAVHTLRQQEINELLIKHAKAGKRVVRLKGGDPFIFGRGGEEIGELARHRIPFQVVPGITAASGCASYAGIPLTHRDYAQSVRFVTGHLQNNTIDLPWGELVHPTQTVVFYMGLLGLPVICEQLIAHGRGPGTPIALIQQGTTREQKVVVGTLADMAERVAREQIHAPTLIIVGEVVKLREKLAWYEKT